MENKSYLERATNHIIEHAADYALGLSAVTGLAYYITKREDIGYFAMGFLIAGCVVGLNDLKYRRKVRKLERRLELLENRVISTSIPTTKLSNEINAPEE